MRAHRVDSKRPFVAYFPSICHSTIIIPHCTPVIQINSQHHYNDIKKKTRSFSLAWPSLVMSHYTMLYKYGKRTRNYLRRFLCLFYFSFLFFFLGGGVFNKTIILIALVGYEMISQLSATRLNKRVMTLVS